MDTNTTLMYLFPDVDRYVSWRVEQSGDIQTITEWNLPDPQPTDAELEAAWPAAEADKATKKAARKAEKDDLDARFMQKLGFSQEEYDSWKESLPY